MYEQRKQESWNDEAKRGAETRAFREIVTVQWKYTYFPQSGKSSFDYLSLSFSLSLYIYVYCYDHFTL